VSFDYLQIRHSYDDYRDSRRLNKAILLGVEINHVVHEIQKERSISTGFTANEGYDFAKQLAMQRNRTDSTLREFYFELENSNLAGLLKTHQDDVDFVRSYFDKIPEIRRSVDRLTISADQVIKYYSDINEVALNTVNKLINETRDKEVAQQVHAIIYFLKSKERASIERAIGTHAFSEKQLDYKSYNQFSSLVAAQAAYLDDFLTITNQESVEYFERIVQGPDIDEVDRLREVLFQNNEFDEDPAYWYKVSTTRINALKKVEDYMSDRILSYTDNISNSAFINFWTFLILDVVIGLVAFFLTSTIVTNLLENVATLEDFTKKISKGDYNSKVHINTKDELGHYANTFNVMVGEIRKSHKELKKERDRARFLYKNIYQVAQVVFENIQQGIFLLDKDFRISKFHSRAMKGIFDNEHIAGEDFTNFMRSLILPRELEALEMFMKHLFNPEMDVDVVNQLNPVEQVKIYTEKGGIVTSKYVRMDFTRIERKGQIQSIMVTVSDETESVLLQQHLKEAEAKKKQETEQVLSILKTDPSVLRGFIFNTKNTLISVSKRYEDNKGGDLRDLLNFTFETVHNLKGNASVIGLDIIANKFHEIEESLTKFKDKEVIKSQDFLTILYEIDEVDSILANMNEMLRKVAEIYKKFPSEGQIVSNIMVIDTLQKGMEKISKEKGKSAELSFDNEKNIVIPESMINPFKDIMIQLIRNSISHGIEDPNERVNKGKHNKGKITIGVDQQNEEELIVTYKDDGAGLDLEEIKSKAIERNVITAFDAEKLSKEKTVELIFNKGFSTADKVDNYAGRGQGMNLVKTIIEGLNGSYDINFKEGSFFEMVLYLPVTPEDEKEKVA
jgi:HAMP domain-containing protein/signal transduction histidine kinase